MRRTLLLAVLVLSACASSSAQGTGTTPASGNGANSDVVCKEETPIGSNIPREVCRSKAQSDDERKDAQDMLGATRPTPPPRQ